MLAVDLMQMHAEAPKPRLAFWTSTRIEPDVSPWLSWPEAQLRGPLHVYQLTVAPRARIAEIHSPQDWSLLCREYPGTVPGYVFTTDARHRRAEDSRLDPEWSSVAREFDGVHVSIGGLVTAEDVPYTEGGVTTELRGWNMESTCWLRWSFTSANPLSAVRGEGRQA